MAPHDSERGSSQYANECEGGEESNSRECLTLLQWVSQAEKTIRIHPSSISDILITGKGVHSPLDISNYGQILRQNMSVQNNMSCALLTPFFTRLTILVAPSTNCLTPLSLA